MPLSFRTVIAALTLGAVVFVAQSGADEKPPPQLQDKTAEAFKNLQALVTAAENATTAHDKDLAQQKWQASVDLLNSLVGSVPADSYDRFMMEDTMGKIYWQGLNQPATAVEHFKNALDIAQSHPEFLAEKERLEHIKWISEAYYQAAIDDKGHPQEQKQAYDDSMQYMKQYLDQTKNPAEEDEMLYAMLLYTKATAIPNHLDRPALNEAITATRRALALSAKPRSDLLQLLVAELENEGKIADAADYLELLLQIKPMSKDFWEQLFAAYNNLAEDSEKNPMLQREYYARAINAMERAQALGYLKTPRDNYNLVSLYTEAGQLTTAVKLLQAGLRTGGIEDKPENWIYLASFYDELDKPMEAINALKEGVKHFPDDSDLYFQVAQYYSQNYDTANTYRWAKAAIAHNHFKSTKRWQAEYALAYAAYELQKYPDALKAVDSALKTATAEKQSLQLFRTAIIEAIKQQEAAKKAAAQVTNS